MGRLTRANKLCCIGMVRGPKRLPIALIDSVRATRNRDYRCSRYGGASSDPDSVPLVLWNRGHTPAAKVFPYDFHTQARMDCLSYKSKGCGRHPGGQDGEYRPVPAKG